MAADEQERRIRDLERSNLVLENTVRELVEALTYISNTITLRNVLTSVEGQVVHDMRRRCAEYKRKVESSDGR